MLVLGAVQDEATLKWFHLIITTWPNCLFKVAQALLLTLWLNGHVVTHWWLLHLLHAHLVSGHCNLVSLVAALPASLAILPSGWMEEVSQVLCKIRQMEEKPTHQHQTTHGAAPQLSHAGLGGSLWARARVKGWIGLQCYVCKKKKKKSVAGKQREAGFAETSKRAEISEKCWWQKENWK